MPTRTVLVSDAFAFAFLRARPEASWEPSWKPYRDRAIVTPEYGLLYIAAILKERGWPFEVVNMVVDRWGDLRWFEISDACRESEAARKELDRLVEEMLQEALARVAAADLVLVPLAYYYLVRGVKRVLREMRKAAPSATFVVGGNYATLHAQDILEEGLADIVVRGEGEATVEELIQSVDPWGRLRNLFLAGISHRADGASIRHNPPRPRIDDLDSLPHLYTAADEFRVAERHRMLKTLMPYGDYFVGSSMVTSRGCPEECTFCLDPTIWERRVRFHSPEYVRAVVDYCMTNFHTTGVPRFYFGDATFTLKKARLWRLLELLEGTGWEFNVQTRADMLDEETLRRMYKAGFRTVALGAESFDDQVLSQVVLKRQTSEQVIRAALQAREAGITPVLTFIAGLPGEGKESHLRTVRILREHGLEEATFFPLVVFRGTPLYSLFLSGMGREKLEEARLDPESEEFFFLSEEFPTRESLISWTKHLNSLIRGRERDLTGSSEGHFLAQEP